MAKKNDTGESIDIAQYVHLPALELPALIALGHALVTASPDEEGTKSALKAVKKSLKAVEAAEKTRGANENDPEDAERTPRLVDHEVDAAWGSLFRRLEALAELALFGEPRAVRAIALKNRLYPPPDGARFLNDEFAVEWQKVKGRLELIEEQKLAPEIDELAGPEYLPRLRSTFEEYGRVLGITSKAEAQEAAVADVRGARRELVNDLRDYAVAVLGLRKKNDSKSLARVRAALLPIDEARARHPAPKRKSSDPSMPASKPPEK